MDKYDVFDNKFFKDPQINQLFELIKSRRSIEEIDIKSLEFPKDERFTIMLELINDVNFKKKPNPIIIKMISSNPKPPKMGKILVYDVGEYEINNKKLSGDLLWLFCWNQMPLNVLHFHFSGDFHDLEPKNMSQSLFNNLIRGKVINPILSTKITHTNIIHQSFCIAKNCVKKTIGRTSFECDNMIMTGFVCSEHCGSSFILSGDVSYSSMMTNGNRDF